MSRYKIENKGKTVFGRVDLRSKTQERTLPHTWGDKISVFLKPGEKVIIAGPFAELAKDQITIIAKQSGCDIKITELQDTLQERQGEPVWVVIADPEARDPRTAKLNPKTGKLDPATAEKVKFPLPVHAMGATWLLDTKTPLEVTQWVAEGIMMSYAWAVKKNDLGQPMIMPLADYETLLAQECAAKKEEKKSSPKRAEKPKSEEEGETPPEPKGAEKQEK